MTGTPMTGTRINPTYARPVASERTVGTRSGA